MTPVKVYRSPSVTVSDQTLAGRGVIANSPIAKDDIIAVKAGHIVHHEEVTRITQEIGDFALQIHDDLYVTPRYASEVDDLTVFMNHSCNANVGFFGSVIYVATRDIAAGEELCHDYALARNDDYRLNCQCGETECRKTVTGRDWMLPDVQKKYGKYFSGYLLEKIAARASAAV